MNITRLSKIVTLEIETEIDWDQDEDGTKTYLTGQVQTHVPITVEAWAINEAWKKICGVKQ